MRNQAFMLFRNRQGAVVQLVRIPACHAVGREFESRPHRKNIRKGVFVFCAETESREYQFTWSRVRVSSAPQKGVTNV